MPGEQVNGLLTADGAERERRSRAHAGLLLRGSDDGAERARVDAIREQSQTDREFRGSGGGKVGDDPVTLLRGFVHGPSLDPKPSPPVVGGVLPSHYLTVPELLFDGCMQHGF